MNKQDTIKQQFNKSLGSGVKSLFGGGGKTYYVLEHRTHSQKHKAGKVQEIIVDYIELGRDSRCQVRFENDMPTVSRRHAAIIKEDDKWVIKNLSQVNQTIVNGRPVANKWYLNTGDEIQLSAEGPKIGFIVPEINTVKSIGFTKRMSLFRQQALRPYKTAITVLSFVLLFVVIGLGYGIYDAKTKVVKLEKETEELGGQIVKLTDQFEDAKEISLREIDSLRVLNLANEQARNQMSQKVSRMEGTINRLIVEQQNLSANHSFNNQDIISDFSGLYPYVYQIILESIELVFEGEVMKEEINSPIGSGFLLNSKNFITARHVIEPWYYISGEDMELIYMNALVQMGADLTAKYTAISPAGTSFSFTNKDFALDRSKDENYSFTDADGDQVLISVAPMELSNTDWARISTNIQGGLPFDSNLSNRLSMRTNLYVLGYPLGMAARSGANISPIYGSCVVGADGLQNGVIMISARNFERGNSGGPVFVEKQDGSFTVVGIISAGAGDNIGFIVPISAVR
jgi:V8-like Glu-specific endopeptidase